MSSMLTLFFSGNKKPAEAGLVTGIKKPALGGLCRNFNFV